MMSNVLIALLASVIHSTRAKPPSPQAVAVQEAMTKAIYDGVSEFALPAGDIYFHDAPFEIVGARNIAIAGEETTLYFGPGFGIKIENSTHTTLHGVTVDYSPLPYVVGTVAQGTNDTSTIVQADPSQCVLRAMWVLPLSFVR